ncbi:MAG: hypothetical protein Q4B67_00095 [Eubacteriales bacterium]|nr:hypothetical protein [Eubacteriales bacterium]
MNKVILKKPNINGRPPADEKTEKLKKSAKQSLTTTVLLVLLALAGVTAATTAWFSIANYTRVRSMVMDLTSGYSLRFDLDPHEDFEQYRKTLSFGEIRDRIFDETGTDIEETPLEPVTTDDGEYYTFEFGDYADPETGVYLEFTLHFMAQRDMLVHLTSIAGDDDEDFGTLIASDNPDLARAMRVSFEKDGEIVVYNPKLDDERYDAGAFDIIGIPPEEDMLYNHNNELFSLRAGVDTPVIVRVWLEGTDELCTNDLIGENYELRLRFEGTDFEHRLFDTRG